MTEPAPRAPDAAAARSWVWHATVESREAGKVSVLACVETLVAVALYWWIAIRWDTHWHLLSSVFIAPLLLLRSPESMKLGVRWFMKDWLGLESSKEWPSDRRWLWLVGVVVFAVSASCLLVFCLTKIWPMGQLNYWVLFVASLLICGLPLVIAVCGIARNTTNVVPWVRAIIGDRGADESAFEGALLGVVLGLGLALRSLAFRLCATLKYLPQGFLRLADNWRENNFWVDIRVPAELMPGLRKEFEHGVFASDHLIQTMAEEKSRVVKWVFAPYLAVFLFLPVFLYRLNIKATCWFWWPLAYLLKPVPKADKSSTQKQALCWPWDDPWQQLLIFVPAVLMCAVLIDRYSDFEMWQQYKNADAVPVPLKLVLGMQWSHLPPWHVAMVFIASSGLGMLAISGAACSHKRNDNWDSYAQSGMSKHLWLMNALTKVRSLATGTFLILGLGMCLISFPEWRQRVPDAVMLRMDRFYHAQTVW